VDSVAAATARLLDELQVRGGHAPAG
jgi:hypothetical protein